MKQKYLLIGAAIILSILIIITSFLGNFSKKTQVLKTFQESTPYNSKNNLNNQLLTPTVSTGQKNYVAFQNLIGILSGPNLSSTQATPPSRIDEPSTTSSTPPLTTEQKSQQNYEAFNDLLGIMFGQASAQNSGSQQQSSFYSTSPSPSSKSPSSTLQPQNLSSTINPLSSNFVYYPQCKGQYDNYPMPNGCNVCTAGCGPVSVSMILSSYVDKKFDPPTVLDLYKQSGLTAGCQGTTIVDAQIVLSQNGMKTTDILYYGDSSTAETVQDIKNYLQNGWTIFTLVKYDPKWGHFFWIVDVDENNNVLAYDPADGTKPIPLNESNVSPSPKYYLAIGVRK